MNEQPQYHMHAPDLPNNNALHIGILSLPSSLPLSPPSLSPFLSFSLSPSLSLPLTYLMANYQWYVYVRVYGHTCM